MELEYNFLFQFSIYACFLKKKKKVWRQLLELNFRLYWFHNYQKEVNRLFEREVSVCGAEHLTFHSFYKDVHRLTYVLS